MGWRLLGFTLLLISLLAASGEFFEVRFPTVRLMFLFRETLPWLGWSLVFGLALIGVILIVISFFRKQIHPVTLRKWKSFRRGWSGVYGLLGVLLLGGLACFDFVLMGNEALLVKYENQYFFPAFTETIEEGQAFGWDKSEPIDYWELQHSFQSDEDSTHWVLMPWWPHHAMNNDPQSEEVVFPLSLTSSPTDVLTSLYTGLQVYFLAGLIYLPVVTVIGTCFGFVMGYYRGFLELVLQRFVEVLSCVPLVLLAVLIGARFTAAYQGEFLVVIASVAVVGWLPIAQKMRAAVQIEREKEFVVASRVFGASSLRVILRQVIPNSISSVVAAVPEVFTTLLITLTVLDFLGFGFGENWVTWGKLLREGWLQGGLPLVLWSPFLALGVVLALIALIGQSLKRAFVPARVATYQ